LIWRKNTAEKSELPSKNSLPFPPGKLCYVKPDFGYNSSKLRLINEAVVNWANSGVLPEYFLFFNYKCGEFRLL
jgi:hypothetical protein